MSLKLPCHTRVNQLRISDNGLIAAIVTQREDGSAVDQTYLMLSQMNGSSACQLTPLQSDACAADTLICFHEDSLMMLVPVKCDGPDSFGALLSVFSEDESYYPLPGVSVRLPQHPLGMAPIAGYCGRVDNPNMIGIAMWGKTKLMIYEAARGSGILEPVWIQVYRMSVVHYMHSSGEQESNRAKFISISLNPLSHFTSSDPSVSCPAFCTCHSREHYVTYGCALSLDSFGNIKAARLSGEMKCFAGDVKIRGAHVSGV